MKRKITLVGVICIFLIVLGIAISTKCPDISIRKNIEALSDTEIIVGPLCMECRNAACTSLGKVYLDNYPV